MPAQSGIGERSHSWVPLASRQCTGKMPVPPCDERVGNIQSRLAWGDGQLEPLPVPGAERVGRFEPHGRRADVVPLRRARERAGLLVQREPGRAFEELEPVLLDVPEPVRVLLAIGLRVLPALVVAQRGEGLGLVVVRSADARRRDRLPQESLLTPAQPMCKGVRQEPWLGGQAYPSRRLGIGRVVGHIDHLERV